MEKKYIFLILAVLGLADRITAIIIGSADEGIIGGLLMTIFPPLGVIIYFIFTLWPLWAIVAWYYWKQAKKKSV